jgi:DDE superfamily endonuclease
VVAVAFSMAWLAEAVEPPGAPGRAAQTPAARLAAFRDAFYGCLTARADALSELCEAVLCADGPVASLAELSLSPVFRRGHGALYDALAEGGLDADRLRDALVAALPEDLPLMFAVDVSAYPRPDAECSPGRDALPRRLPLRRQAQDHPGLALLPGERVGMGQP